jgi:hypothetical protein
MDTIEFRVGGSRHAKRGVSILINGHNLIPMVRKHELPMAEAEGHANIAGSYSPRQREGFLKDHNEIMAGTHRLPKLSLFCCGDCGELGCWPLDVKITIEGDQVVWSDFEQPYRRDSWDYSTFGPFNFDVDSYNKALTTAGLASEK